MAEADRDSIFPTRTEWVEETTRGEFESDPGWSLFADDIETYSPAVDFGMGAQQAVGTHEDVDYWRGAEDTQLTVEYRLQQWWVDGSDDVQDAGAYGMERASDNHLHGTHTVQRRVEKSNGGAESAGRRIYGIARGCRPNVDVEFGVDDELPILVTVEYEVQAYRELVIDQPSSDQNIGIKSTDSNDTGTSVTIEDEDAATAETISLDGSDGTTLVETSSTYGDVDVVELASAIDGDLEVYTTDGAGATNNQIATIPGGNTMSDDDNPHSGWLGVPALGSGSHASALGQTYYDFTGDTVERPSGSQFEVDSEQHDIHAVSASFDNGYAKEAQQASYEQAIDEQNLEATLDVTVAGPIPAAGLIKEHVTKVINDLKWDPDPSGTKEAVFKDCSVFEVGEPEDTAESDRMTVDATLRFKRVNLTG